MQATAAAGAIAPSAFSMSGKKPPAASRSKPNVVIIITDDQGYGDLAFTGNPAIKTPALCV